MILHRDKLPVQLLCQQCHNLFAYYNVCTYCSRCFTHCLFTQQFSRSLNRYGIYVSMDLITHKEFTEGITHKMTTIVNGTATIDVEFQWKTTDGLIEKQTVRGISLGEYPSFRKLWVDVMIAQGHIPFVPSYGKKPTSDEKQYIWLNGTGTKILPCKDESCDGKAHYIEGEQKDKKPFQSIRCDKFTDYNNDTEKKRHTNWYNNQDHLLQVSIATNEKHLVRGKLVPSMVTVELPERGGNQHDTAKEIYGTDDTTGGDIDGMPF